jgi:hypothetical protein
MNWVPAADHDHSQCDFEENIYEWMMDCTYKISKGLVTVPDWLNKVKIGGATPEQKLIFQSALMDSIWFFSTQAIEYFTVRFS